MSEDKTNNQAKVEKAVKEEPKGFFARIVNKIDGAMKVKADEKSKNGGCCGGDDKGGKCC